VDMLSSIARRENWKLTYVPGSWEECLSRLASGQLDLMPDVAINTEREKVFSFHKESVLSSWSQLYALRDSKIKSILDIDNQRLAVLGGSVQEQEMVSLIQGFGLKVQLLPYRDYQTAFLAVVKGEADAAVSNYFYGLLHARSLGLVETTVVFSPANLYFATPKGRNLDLLDRIDANLLRLKSNPKSEYYQILRKWTSEKVSFRLPDWLIFTLIGITVLLLASVIIVLILRRLVNLRTQELTIANQEMELRIKLRTADLVAAMEQAQAADKIKSAFLATMSHELRTPLNSIIGFTGVLLQELPGKLNDEQKKQLKMVQNSARHLLSLINDILDISKIEAGQFKVAWSEFNLYDTIDKLVKTVQPLADSKHLLLVSHTSPLPLMINSDQRRLEQVLLNLLSNAVKFTETGKVEINCAADEHLYRIQVRDTGIGIPAEEMGHIFEPFRQLDHGLTRKYEGTGLGLTISKRIIDILGGTITVESINGKGSIFTVTIPVQKGAQT